MANVTAGSLTSPKSVVVNINEGLGSDGILDLAKLFDLQRIKIEYSVIKPGQIKPFTVHPQCNHFAYIIKGNGTLNVGEEEDKDKDNLKGLKKDDCFSFPPLPHSSSYLIKASEDEMGIITFADPHGTERPVINIPPDSKIPTVRPALSLDYLWKRGKQKKEISLTGQTDIVLSAPTDMTALPPIVLNLLRKNNIPPERAPKYLFLPWNVNIHEFVPGTYSSNPHCHSLEDEMAVVLSGKARYWFQGEEPEKILRAGDCVGWKAGTGVCHSLLNDADGPDGEGEPLVILVWGDNDPVNDKLHYPTANPSWWNDSNRWFDRPNLPMGNALPVPRYARPVTE